MKIGPPEVPHPRAEHARLEQHGELQLFHHFNTRGSEQSRRLGNENDLKPGSRNQ